MQQACSTDALEYARVKTLKACAEHMAQAFYPARLHHVEIAGMQIGQRNVVQQNAVCGIDRDRDVAAGLPCRRECGVGAGEQPVMQLDSVLPRREVRDRIAPNSSRKTKVSLPAPPVSVSSPLPAPPSRTLALASPMSVSLKLLPVRFSMLP
jgi:hypothetical protein